MIEHGNAAQDHVEEVPTSAAYVAFSTTSGGPSVTVSVPSGQSNLLVGAVSTLTGVAGSALAPYLMARALGAVTSEVPWPLEFGLLLLAALLPLAYVTIGRRN